MHKIIRILIRADDKEEAFYSSRDIAEDLVEKGIYDWFTMFDEGEEEAPTSGKQRWGEYEPVVKYTSEMGTKWIKTGIEHTIDDMNKSLEEIRKILGEHTNKEVMEDFRLLFPFHMLSSNNSISLYVYDRYGEPIKTMYELNESLAGKEDEFWTVPIDVHF